MKLLTLFIALAALATVVALVLGIASMTAKSGQVLHRTSERWMTWRIALQALALGLLLLAFLETP